MRRRFSSQYLSADSRRRNTRRQRVRKLTFDSLEDRRLLAGLNIFVYDDVNRSGGWDSPSELPIAEQVVYVDIDNNQHLNGDERYAITGADGKALIENIAEGVAMLRLLGSTSPATVVSLPEPTSRVDVAISNNAAVGNRAPVLSDLPSQTVDEDSLLSLGRSVFAGAASDADDDPLWFFVVGKPTNGTLTWSVETGGSYQPANNFYGSDTVVIRAFDGKAWSAEVSLRLSVNNVDDLPTGIEFAGGTVPENQLGYVVGPITIIDIDGGPNSILLTPEDLYEIQDGKLKLGGDKSLNFEESPSSNLSVLVYVGNSQNPVLSQSISLSVENRNDAPSALVFGGQPRVEEFIAGFEFGTIQVIDEDVGDQYDFLVSDNRFVVVDGKLALKAGTSLVYADASSVSVTVTAVSQTNSDQLSETIDIEVVRAAPPWQNKNWALDVNNDNELTPLDVLIVINALNRIGVSPLDRLPPTGSSTFVDVNGDRYLTPLDALILINALNVQSRGLGEGSSNGGGNGSPGGGNGSPGGGSGSPGGGGIGEGEQAAPPASPKFAGELNQIDSQRATVSSNNTVAAIDDDNLSSSNARKTARRVR